MSVPAPAPNAKRTSHPLLAAQAAAAERIPGVRTILDKAASRLAEPSRLLAGVEAAATLAEIKAQTLSDLLDALPAGGAGGVFRLKGWNASLVMALDPALAFGLTDAALGGDGVEEPSGEVRPPSRIDLALARMMLENAGVALQRALGGVRPAELTLETVESRFDRVECGQRRGRAVAARIDVAVFGRAAPLWVVLPVEVLNVLQQAAAPAGEGRAAPADPVWRNRFGGEVGQTHVVVRAMMTDRSLTLADIAALTVGQTLRLQVSADAPVLIESQNRRLFRGTLGQADGRYTVRIESAVGDKPGRADLEPGGRSSSALKPLANRKPSMSVSAIEPPDDLAGVASPGSGFGHVLGIPVTVDVVLGSTTMLVADLMKLGRGAILPLDGKVGDHVTIAVNGRAVARGEIVVLEDEDFRLGVSLTEVMGSASSSSGA